MPFPRPVVPGRFLLITRRCTQRQFLMRPDDKFNQIYLYCLAEAAARFNIRVCMTCAMSNHHHTIIYDRDGRYPEFIERMHLMIARCANRLRKRRENFWSNAQTSVVHLVGWNDLLAKLVYVAVNPVKACLVQRVDLWPGVNTLRALLNGKTLVVKRPRGFFRVTDGAMPAEVTLRCELPPELADRDAMLEQLRKQVSAFEKAQMDECSRTGKRVVGRRRVKEQSVTDRPTTEEPRRELNPHVAAIDEAERNAHIDRYFQFLDEYRAARRSWLSGEPTKFPLGTYWLRRFASVPIAQEAAN